MASVPALVLSTRFGEHRFSMSGEPSAGVLPQVVEALEPRIFVRWGTVEMTPRDLVALAVGVLLLLRGVGRK